LTGREEKKERGGTNFGAGSLLISRRAECGQQLVRNLVHALTRKRGKGGKKGEGGNYLCDGRESRVTVDWERQAYCIAPLRRKGGERGKRKKKLPDCSMRNAEKPSW